MQYGKQAEAKCNINYKNACKRKREGLTCNIGKLQGLYARQNKYECMQHLDLRVI